MQHQQSKQQHAKRIAQNALSEQVSAADTIKEATSRKVAQNNSIELKQELGNAATTLQTLEETLQQKER